MTTKFKTRDVDKSLYVNYLKRAEECYHAARSSFEAQEWNAATISAIHTVIAASDAMCVYFLGKRNASESHNEAVALFKIIEANNEEININANRISRILAIKNMAEYEDRLVFKKEAEKVLRDCEQLFRYIKTKLPK
jgi:uncharacterized protein (UPF0332 family)